MNAIFSIAQTTPIFALTNAASLSLRISNFAKNIFVFLSFQTTRASLALRYSFDLARPFLPIVAFIAFIFLINKLIDDPQPLPAARGIDPPHAPPEARAALEAQEVLALIDRINAATAAKQTRIEDLLTAGIGRKYYCSLDLALIRDPVRDPTAAGDEHVYYERAAIEAALRINARSPHTRQPLTVGQLLEAPPEYFATRAEALLRTFRGEIDDILDRDA